MPSPTRRIVLERRMVVDHDATENAFAKPYEAWVPVGFREGITSDQACEAYAGKSFQPDCKPGMRRAVSLNAWPSPTVTEADGEEQK